MPKAVKKQLSDDEIRSIILKYLHKLWKTGRGINSSKPPISKIKRDLKKEGLTEKEIVRNLVYLIETGWVKEEKEKYTLTSFAQKPLCCTKSPDKT